MVKSRFTVVNKQHIVFILVLLLINYCIISLQVTVSLLLPTPVLNEKLYSYIVYLFLKVFKDFIYLLIFREKGKEKERESNIDW